MLPLTDVSECSEDVGDGEISSFGALFWMVVTAFFGMATKYSEGLLAVKYRVITKDGHSLGGPFYYIERGMGKNWKWLLCSRFLFFCAHYIRINTVLVIILHHYISLRFLTTLTILSTASTIITVHVTSHTHTGTLWILKHLTLIHI